MSARGLKALTRHFYEEFNKGTAPAMAVIAEACSTDCVLHGGTGADIRGLEGFKQFFINLFNAFPDIHFTIDDMVVEADKIATRFEWTGTHKGEFMGIPPTNKKVTMWLIQIDRIVRGKVVEGWTRYDTLGLMQQLGLAPTPQKEK